MRENGIMPIRSEVNDNGRSLIIHVNGDFSYDQYSQFKQACSSINENIEECIIDLENTNHLESAALGMLLLLKARAVKLGLPKLVITNHTPEVDSFLRIMNFDDLFFMQ